MFRPERMTSASIICVKQDVESVLEALSSFGEFQIEKAPEDKTTSTEYGQRILKAEENLSNIKGLIKQLNKKKSGFLDIFKTIEPTRVQVTSENWQSLFESTNQQVLALKKEVDALNASLLSIQGKTAQLDHVKEMLTMMGEMKVDLGVLQNLKSIYVVIASLPNKIFDKLKTALTPFPLFLGRGYATKGLDIVSIAVPIKHTEDVNKILKLYRAEIFSIPKELPQDLTEALNEVDNQLKEVADKEKSIRKSLKKLSEEFSNKLASWKEITENIIIQLNAKKKILESGRLAVVSGFVVEKKFAALDEKVHVIAGERALVLKNKVAESQDPPSKISNNRFVKPFEVITRLYGMPHYNEIDPTPILAITFPILFGLMFGDAGHGMVLMAGGLVLGVLLKNNQGIRNMCWIIAACGAASTIIGVLFGEYFGLEDILGLGLHPLWFSPVHTVFDFLVLSLIVGVIQILSGLVLEMADFIVKRKVADAILLCIPKIAFYLGSVYVIISCGLNLGAWFAGPILLIIVPVILMMFAKPAYTAIAHKISHSAKSDKKKEENGESLGERIFESGDLVTRLLSNTISYSRILALLMAHWALLLVFYSIAELVAFPISLIVIIFGNLLVIALEGIIVFIHTLRLHFYEWFSRFYRGDGVEFRPFKHKFVYTDLILKKE